MIRRPPRSTLDRSSAASDVYKRQGGHRFDSDILHSMSAFAKATADKARKSALFFDVLLD